MKKLTHLLYICFLVLGLSACELETSDNGSLDGFWQLSAIDSLNNGHSADMRQSSIYWGVQVNLLNIRDLKRKESFMFRFELKNDTLRLYAPVKDIRPSASEVLDERVMNSMELRHIGLSRLDEKFKVLHLTGSRMTLESEHFRMHFRKY